MKKAGEFWVPDEEKIQLDALGAGGWQLDHLEAALSHVRHWRVAIDGGAHVGSWTRAMAARFERVIAFEPWPETFECLKLNVQDLPNVECVGIALGEYAGSVGMSEDGKYSDGGNTGGRYVAGGGRIAMRPLDTMQIEDLDFLKLDVEGYELFALMGARETIKRCRPVICIEVKHRMAARFELPVDAAGKLLGQLGLAYLGQRGSDHFFGGGNDRQAGFYRA